MVRASDDLPNFGLNEADQWRLLGALSRAGVSLLPITNHGETAAPTWLPFDRADVVVKCWPPKSLLDSLGIWLAQFHQASSSLVPPMTQTREYAERARAWPEFSQIEPELFSARNVAWLHSDLHLGNMLVNTSSGSPTLAGVIDWEYARVGWKYLDIADVLWRVCALTKFGQSPEQVIRAAQLFLDAYGLSKVERRAMPLFLSALLRLRGDYLREAVSGGHSEFGRALDELEQMSAILARYKAEIVDSLE